MEKIRIKKVSKKKVRSFGKKTWKKFNIERGFSWNQKEFFYLAYQKKRAIGFFRLRIIGRVAELKELLVVKEYRDKGVGQELLKKCEQIAKNKDCFKIKLFTSEKHKEALKFYKKNGYKKEGELKNDLFHFDWYWLTKNL
ncbi:MAG: GNAT family N-acetyltransferase [Candidatus Pacearchaeota archaeon]|nr:MAG: GNAT family N-acetyltransferase [Candidatus Pacearchaeota archaeon]